MEYNLAILAEWINKLDSYYEFSDDPRKLRIGTEKENLIAHWLHGLTDTETDEVKKHLDEDGWLNYNRYFKNK